MTELTKHQKTFVARAAIAHWMGEFETDDGDTLSSIDVSPDGGLTGVPDDDLVALGVESEHLDGYRLALEDLEKARSVMEEEAAFGYLTRKLAEELPNVDKLNRQRTVRRILADPGERRQAAVDSGVYVTLGFGEV